VKTLLNFLHASEYIWPQKSCSANCHVEVPVEFAGTPPQSCLRNHSIPKASCSSPSLLHVKVLISSHNSCHIIMRYSLK
jgi:hypothetical protein